MECVCGATQLVVCPLCSPTCFTMLWWKFFFFYSSLDFWDLDQCHIFFFFKILYWQSWAPNQDLCSKDNDLSWGALSPSHLFLCFLKMLNWNLWYWQGENELRLSFLIIRPVMIKIYIYFTFCCGEATGCLWRVTVWEFGRDVKARIWAKLFLPLHISC